MLKNVNKIAKMAFEKMSFLTVFQILNIVSLRKQVRLWYVPETRIK